MSGPARKRVLLVEDEFLILMFLESIVTRLGYEIAATASSLEQGFAVLSNASFDIAILDVNLNGAHSYRLADKLRTANVAVLFSTGYGGHGLEDRYKDWPVIQKPYDEHELERALLNLASGGPES
jgi:DNA-binding response OmpR family regulator